MLRKLMPAAGGVFGALAAAAGPGLASPCTDQIAALEQRLDEAARAAASASSGGQGVAAAREAQAMQARDQNRPVEPPPAATPFQSAGQEAQATQRAADAGGGGDRVMQARATLNRARALEGQGNGSGCVEAVDEARRQLGN